PAAAMGQRIVVVAALAGAFTALVGVAEEVRVFDPRIAMDRGERIARLGLPTLFIMEGGYAVEAIGINAVNVLQGYEGAAR
ncbi:hypothetical protein LDY98_23335, partial [Pseudomonas aeruginosa]|nr:hypothetical protein [Pseudomonas aeruginosa]